MTVETTTRPNVAAGATRQARPGPGRRRRRVLGTLSAATLLALVVALATGSSALAAVTIVLAALAVGYVVQLVRLRTQAFERALVGHRPGGWTEDELRAWPALVAAQAGVPLEEAAPAAALGAVAEAKPRMMDRWAFTQVLWAGVLGCSYNALAKVAGGLAEGSSLPRLRGWLLGVTGRLLDRLSQQSLRRTVAVSALATASTTGLLVAGSGMAGSALAGAAQVSAASATSSVPTAASASAQGTTYTVQTGDTLWGIAQRFGTTVGALATRNGIADPTLIFAGQVFAIPAAGAGPTAPAATTTAAAVTAGPAQGTTYTVQAGDTLWGIAQRFGTTVGALAAGNGIADPTLVFAGQVLTIPAGGSPGDPATGTSAVVASAPVATPAPPPAPAATTTPAPPAPVAPSATTTPAPPAPPAPVAPSATTTPAPPAPVAPSATTTPAPTSYTVQAGDTLASIAQRFGTSVAALAAANGIGDPTVIYAGQVLTLAGGAPAATPAPAPAPAPAATPAPATLAVASPGGGTASSAGAAAVQAAESQLGVPYVYGGETPGAGFDCSGLAQWAWGQAGVSIPRTSEAQWTSVPHVSLSDLQPGDLLFYYNLDGTGTVDHVAIYVGSGPSGSQTIIQAPYTGATVSFTALYTTGLIGAGQP